MKQQKKADKSAPKKVAKPKLVKKKIVVEDTDIDTFLIDIPKSQLRKLYWNMGISNIRKWIQSFF
jgi:hypothetical protein